MSDYVPEFHAGLLTIPRNLKSAIETCRHLASRGFPEPEIFENTPVVNPTSIDQVHRNIFEGHFAILERFYTKRLPANRRLHLLVFEDDACAVSWAQLRLFDLVRDKVSYLERHYPNWSVLNLGCASMGPVLPVGNGLVMAAAPYSVHAYVVNGRKAGTICKMTRKICKRPLYPEGCSVFPFSERFALFRPLLTQTRLPKEFIFKNIPLVRDVLTYERTMLGLMVISSLAPLVVLMGIGVACYTLVNRMRLVAKQKREE
jgi:hypothetical protein